MKRALVILILLALAVPAFAEELALPEVDALKLRALVLERELYRQAARADKAEAALRDAQIVQAIERATAELAEREGFDPAEYQPNPMTGKWEPRKRD